MAVEKNELKARLAAGECQVGLWLNLLSPVTAELAGQSGYDWCLIDAEHGAHTVESILGQMIALNGTGAHPVVRVPVGQDWVLKQVLDLGVQSVLVPMVDTAAQAEAMVRAVRYPPHGVRGLGASVARASGFGAVADYAPTANGEICLMVQAESRAAIENLEAICAVDGVDVVFIGPADLAADMGYIADLGHPEVQAVIDRAIEVIRASGKAAGIVCFDPKTAAAYRKKGVTFLGVGSDAAVLASGLRTLRAAV